MTKSPYFFQSWAYALAADFLLDFAEDVGHQKFLSMEWDLSRARPGRYGPLKAQPTS